MNFREWESLFSLMNQMRFLPSLRQLHAVIFCVSKMWMKEPLSMVVSCARLYAVKRRFGTVGPQWILWNSGILRLVNWGSAMHQFHPISPIIFVDGFPCRRGPTWVTWRAVRRPLPWTSAFWWWCMPWLFGTQSLLWMILKGSCRRRFHGLERQLEPQTYPAACLDSPRYEMKIWSPWWEESIPHAQPGSVADAACEVSESSLGPRGLRCFVHHGTYRSLLRSPQNAIKK